MSNDTAVEQRGIPDELADQIQRAFGLDAPPETLGEWVAVTAHLLADADFDFGVEAMCTSDDSRHVARIDGEPQGFHCVLDTLLLPFVVDRTAVEVRSESPNSAAVVEFTVSQDGVDQVPGDAVMSFGVASDVTVPTDEELDPAVGYQRFCPYVNAFPAEDAYEQWARETPDATTMALPLSTGFELAQALAQSQPFVTE